MALESRKRAQLARRGLQTKKPASLLYAAHYTVLNYSTCSAMRTQTVSSIINFRKPSDITLTFLNGNCTVHVRREQDCCFLYRMKGGGGDLSKLRH